MITVNPHLNPPPQRGGGKKSGYIAIVTALIFSVVALTAAFSVGTAGFISRNAKVEMANKAASYAAARTCLDRAKLQLAQNPSYAGGKTVGIYDYQCSVVSVAAAGQNKVIKTNSAVLGATTNLILTVDGNLATVSFEEVVSH